MTCALNDHIDNFIASVKIMNNLENNDNYKDYNIGLKADFDDFQVQLKNKQLLMVIEPKSVDDDNVGLSIRTYAGMSKDLDAEAIFSDIEDFSEFSEYNKIETDYDLDVEDYPNYYHRTGVRTYLKPNKLPIKGLLHTNTNFLNDSIDYFNKNGKSKEFLILFDKDNKNVSETDIKQMLLDEDVLDANLYKEFQDHYKAENTSLLEPSEYAFINAINEFNERAQNRNDQGLIR